MPKGKGHVWHGRGRVVVSLVAHRLNDADALIQINVQPPIGRNVLRRNVRLHKEEDG